MTQAISSVASLSGLVTTGRGDPPGHWSLVTSIGCEAVIGQWPSVVSARHGYTYVIFQKILYLLLNLAMSKISKKFWNITRPISKPKKLCPFLIFLKYATFSTFYLVTRQNFQLKNILPWCQSVWSAALVKTLPPPSRDIPDPPPWAGLSAPRDLGDTIKSITEDEKL